jgi:hypothetical protein
MNSELLKRVVIFVFGLLAAGLGIFFVGAASAMMPTMAVRAAPLFLLIVVALFALLSRNGKGILSSLGLIWLVGLISVFSLWPTYIFFSVGGLPAIDPRKIVALGSTGLLFYLLLNKSYALSSMLGKENVAVRKFSLIVLTYLGLRFLSSFSSESIFSSTIFFAWDFVNYYSVLLLALILLDKDAHKYFLRTLLWVAFFVGAYALLEKAMGHNFLTSFAPRSERFSDFARAMMVERLRDGFFRAQSTFEHPLLLAEFAALSFCFSLSVLLLAQSARSRMWSGALCIVLLATVWATNSRAAYLAVAVSGVSIFLLRVLMPSKEERSAETSLRKVKFFSIVFIGLLCAIPLILIVLEGGSRDERSSSMARIAMLELGVPSLIAHPILGIGPGMAGSVAGITTGAGVATLDNYLLAVAMDSGIPAFILFLLTILYPAWLCINYILNGNKEGASFMLGACGACLSYLVMRSILWMPFNLGVVNIVLALVVLLAGKSFLKSRSQQGML